MSRQSPMHCNEDSTSLHIRFKLRHYDSDDQMTRNLIFFHFPQYKPNLLTSPYFCSVITHTPVVTRSLLVYNSLLQFIVQSVQGFTWSVQVQPPRESCFPLKVPPFHLPGCTWERGEASQECGWGRKSICLLFFPPLWCLRGAACVYSSQPCSLFPMHMLLTCATLSSPPRPPPDPAEMRSNMNNLGEENKNRFSFFFPQKKCFTDSWLLYCGDDRNMTLLLSPLNINQHTNASICFHE